MNKIHFRSLLAMALLPGLLAACDNPVSNDDDHASPRGIVLRAGATEMIRVVGFANPVVTGALTVSVGGQTPLLTATYIDDDGDAITLEAGEYSVVVTPASSATATWQGTAEGAFTGRVLGYEAGTTTLGFQLYHGTHPEPGGAYVVPVTVTATQP